MKPSLFFALITILLLSSSHARADEPTSPRKSESRWYGYQTLAADGASLGLILLGTGVADSRGARDGFSGVGIASYVVTPPIIHGVHGHVGRAFGDLAIRVFTPAIGAGIGAIVGAAMYEPPPPVANPQSPGDVVGGAVAPMVGQMAATIEGAAVGFVSGAAVAIAIDAGLLAHEDVAVKQPAEKTAPPQAGARARTITPTIAPTRDGVSAGIVGTF